jgi:uncharacterized UBP type Zn finger protein
MEEQLCTHLDAVEITDLPEPILGCEDCLKTGSDWVHLRMCETCGKVGCCDQSPNQHATSHFREVEHPLMRSAEPGEEWTWCYVDEVGFVLAPSFLADHPRPRRRHSLSRHHAARP